MIKVRQNFQKQTFNMNVTGDIYVVATMVSKIEAHEIPNCGFFNDSWRFAIFQYFSFKDLVDNLYKAKVLSQMEPTSDFRCTGFIIPGLVHLLLIPCKL